MAGLYIHIPFCESRCIYCGFYRTTSLKLRDDYTDALCREMQMRPAKPLSEAMKLSKPSIWAVEPRVSSTAPNSTRFSLLSEKTIRWQRIWRSRWNAIQTM